MAALLPLAWLVAEGDWGSVVAFIRENGNCPALEFLDDLRRRDEDAYGACLALFREIARTGRAGARGIKNEAAGPAISIEFNKMQFRFPVVRDGNRWALLFGFQKQGAQRAWANGDARTTREPGD